MRTITKRRFIRGMALCAVALFGAGCRKVDEAAGATEATPEVQELGPSLEDCLARNSGKRVLILFTMNWGLHGEFIAELMRKPSARGALHRNNAVGVIADLTRRDEERDELQKRHGQAGFPFLALYEPDRTVSPRVWEPGYSTEAELVRMIEEHLGPHRALIN
jgi:thiol:disulfide interchange protein